MQHQLRDPIPSETSVTRGVTFSLVAGMGVWKIDSTVLCFGSMTPDTITFDNATGGEYSWFDGTGRQARPRVYGPRVTILVLHDYDGICRHYSVYGDVV